MKELSHVPMREAARRLRHLIYGQDWGVIMATKAIHGLGDISRSTPNLAAIHDETEDCYIGNFVEGAGFCDVRFSKSVCRELTEEEVARYEEMERRTGNFLQAVTA